jgi:threonine synthase
LKKQFFLTSANSINIARLIPQSFYYFHAYAQLKRRNKPVVFSVPSGNFGNLTGGLLAKRMGLPVEKFIATTNANDVVPKYLNTKLFEPRPSTQTISNAMDVGNPSNFARMLDLYNHDFHALSEDIKGYSFTDEETQHVMREVFSHGKYVMDPHGAVGYLGLKEYLAETNSHAAGIFLETAHPGKFQDVVEDTLQKKVELPEALQEFMRGTKLSVRLGKDFDGFKAYLQKTL